VGSSSINEETISIVIHDQIFKFNTRLLYSNSSPLESE